MMHTSPSIEGLDAKIVSIVQSINQLKDEIIDLVEVLQLVSLQQTVVQL